MLTDQEFEQLLAAIDLMPSGQIPPRRFITSLAGGMGSDQMKIALSGALSREEWPPLQTDLISRDAIKKLLTNWCQRPGG